MELHRATCRYQRRRGEDQRLRVRLRELAEARRRFGYRRLQILLQREGWQVNHKRVYRLYVEAVIMIEVVIEEMVGSDLVFEPERLAASPRLVWQTSTRAKWRSSLSACRVVLGRPLTPPTLLEMAIFRQL
jgi:HTH-like domain